MSEYNINRVISQPDGCKESDICFDDDNMSDQDIEEEDVRSETDDAIAEEQNFINRIYHDSDFARLDSTLNRIKNLLQREVSFANGFADPFEGEMYIHFSLEYETHQYVLKIRRDSIAQNLDEAKFAAV